MWMWLFWEKSAVGRFFPALCLPLHQEKVPPHCRASWHRFGLALEKKKSAWIENWKRIIMRVVGKTCPLNQCFCSSSLAATLEAPAGDNLRELCKTTAIQERFLLAFSLLLFQLPKCTPLAIMKMGPAVNSKMGLPVLQGTLLHRITPFFRDTDVLGFPRSSSNHLNVIWMRKTIWSKN